MFFKASYYLGIIVIMIVAACQHQLDLEKEKEVLLQVDRDFAALSAKDGYIVAYINNLTNDALLLPPGRGINVGRDRIYKEWTEEGLLGKLEWEPITANVAQSGDLGWTWGRWTFDVEDENGKTTRSYGKYIFLWNKINGQWKAAANIWNDNPKP